MTAAFEEKVIVYGMIDTRKYRYVCKGVGGLDEQHLEIRRIEREKLDTTAALEPWELAKEIHL